MNKRIRVLVVDDSAFARFAISKRISADPEIEVVGQARDGIEALDLVRSLQPTVITMDVTMPRMDGIEAVAKIMEQYPTPIVMLSALTHEGAEVTIQALQLGAVDFFCKPSVVSPVGSTESSDELIQKIKMAAGIEKSRLRAPLRSPEKPAAPRGRRKAPKDTGGDWTVPAGRVIVMASSTGGPRALAEVLPRLPGNLPAPILAVQHMPAGFTKSLAERLDEVSQLSIKEAEDGDRIRAGMVLLAPGGKHMTIDAEGRIALNQGPQECGLRPAANITMQSAAEAFGAAVLGVVLTGMGSDGTRGSGLIKKTGGEVIVQDEASCVVYGMPKSIVEAGYADAIVPLSEIPAEILRRCEMFQSVGTGV